MDITNFTFSEKSLDMIMCPSTIDILEGTARSGKSTDVMFKLGLMIEKSKQNQFFIAGATAVVARRNLIDNKNGFLEQYKGCVKEGTNPRYGSHLIFIDSKGMQKIIYIFGFKDKARWKTVLGSSVGGGVIDEINIADIDFINEIYRAVAAVDEFWLGATLNPDDPDLEIYRRLINKGRPLKKYLNDIPPSILSELAKETPIKNIIYWHFNFKDNPIMTEDKVNRFKQMYPPDSFYYASKVLGLRGVVEGVIFGKYLHDGLFTKTITEFIAGKMQTFDEIDYDILNARHAKYLIGVDLGGNQGDKKGTTMQFTGIKRDYNGVDFIDHHIVKATEANDIVIEIADKIQEWYVQIQNKSAFDEVYIDGYGAVGMLLPTIRKRLIAIGLNLKVRLSVKFGSLETQKKVADKAPVGDRLSRMVLLLLLIHQNKVRFKNTKIMHTVMDALKTLVYAEDGLPLDNNQLAMDIYDAVCYTITPFASKLNENIVGSDI